MYTLIFMALLNTNVSIVAPGLDHQTCTDTLRDLVGSVRGVGSVRFSRCVPQADITLKNQYGLDDLMKQDQGK